MSVGRRALIIGMMGPAIQAVGIAWVAAHIIVSHWSTPLAARHLLYEPPVLLVIVGFFVSVACLPVALAVARASEDEVEIPVYGPAGAEAPQVIEGVEQP